jgi:hypothetical protein
VERHRQTYWFLDALLKLATFLTGLEQPNSSRADASPECWRSPGSNLLREKSPKSIQSGFLMSGEGKRATGTAPSPRLYPSARRALVRCQAGACDHLTFPMEFFTVS